MLTDDLPFVAPAIGQLAPAGFEMLAALQLPEHGKPSTKKPQKPEQLQRRQPSKPHKPVSKPAPQPVPQPAGQAPELQPVGLAAVALVLALALAAVACAVVVSRRKATRRSPPVALQLSLLLFGMVVGLTQLAVGDQLLRLFGQADYVWAIILPVSLVGLGSGRLLADEVTPVGLRTYVIMAITMAVIVLLALDYVGPQIVELHSFTTASKLSAGCAVLYGVGICLGAPLGAGLRLAREWEPTAVGHCWAVHAVGWGLGAAAGALLAYYHGVAELLAYGAVMLVLAGLLFSFGSGLPQRAAASPAQL